MAQMTPQVSSVLEKALTLSTQERGGLIEHVIESLDEAAPEAGVEEAWAEIKRRVDDIRSGNVNRASKCSGSSLKNSLLRGKQFRFHSGGKRRFQGSDRMIPQPEPNNNNSDRISCNRVRCGPSNRAHATTLAQVLARNPPVRASPFSIFYHLSG
jgi:putative addiction module component (TIGR02574 family)